MISLDTKDDSNFVDYRTLKGNYYLGSALQVNNFMRKFLL